MMPAQAKNALLFGNNKSFTFLLCVVPLLLLSNCTTLLKANFESDTIGNKPNKLLPGAPSGDIIEYANDIENQVDIVATPESAGNKSTRYQSVTPIGDIGGHGAWISFKAKSSNFSNAVSFTWTARKNFNSLGMGMLIDVSDGSGIVAARLRISGNGDVYMIKSFENNLTELIGKIENDEKHSFIITVNLSSGNYNLSITKPSGNITKNGNNLVMTDITLFHNPANPTVAFKFENFGVPQHYIIDEVIISRRNN